jgi:hypothetical protein
MKDLLLSQDQVNKSEKSVGYKVFSNISGPPFWCLFSQSFYNQIIQFWFFIAIRTGSSAFSVVRNKSTKLGLFFFTFQIGICCQFSIKNRLSVPIIQVPLRFITYLAQLLLCLSIRVSSVNYVESNR